MNKTLHHLVQNFFKDDKGKVVILMWPNPPLGAWLISKALLLTLNPNHFKGGLEQLATALLFTWAFLELTNGVNYFRKSLGLIVIAMVILGYLR